MQVIISAFGAYVHVKDGIFEISVNGDKHRVSPKKIHSICIATGASFSSDSIKLAVENNIDILFLDKFGDPIARVWHDRLGSTARIRTTQLRLSISGYGIEYAKQFIRKKFDNQIHLLKRIRKRRTRLSTEITETIQHIRDARTRMIELSSDNPTIRETIMGIEGYAARMYWQMLSILLPERFRFDGRSRSPARDEFNCLLNYAYGVLYGIVQRACVLSGIDPYVGFIHTDNYARKSMVFDVIEGYRIFADETVLRLFSSKQVKKDLFSPLKNGVTLNSDGKKVLLAAYNEYLDKPVLYRNRKIKRRDTIQYDLHKMANEWIRDHETE